LPASRAGQVRAAAGCEQAGTWWLHCMREREAINWQSVAMEMPPSGGSPGKVL